MSKIKTKLGQEHQERLRLARPTSRFWFAYLLHAHTYICTYVHKDGNLRPLGLNAGFREFIPLRPSGNRAQVRVALTGRTFLISRETESGCISYAIDPGLIFIKCTTCTRSHGGDEMMRGRKRGEIGIAEGNKGFLVAFVVLVCLRSFLLQSDPSIHHSSLFVQKSFDIQRL